MSPHEPILDHRQSSLTSFQRPQEFLRSHASPWPQRAPSVESLASTNTQASSISPVLRKRHSTYIHSHLPDRSTSPIPELPPQRPPRNPARVGSVLSEASGAKSRVKTLSRSSTTTGSREDVTPWEFQSAPGDEKRRMRSTAPSVRSRASSTGLAISTGTVEEVTPWELFPAPENIPTPQIPASNSVTALLPAIPSPSSLHPKTATGLVEDVTPWELSPPASPQPTKSEFGIKATNYSSTSHPRSKPASVVSVGSVRSHRLSTVTGLTEEVTPWELQSLPTPEEVEENDAIPSIRQRNSLTMTIAQLEEITPWELYPAPPTSTQNDGVSSSKDAHSLARPSNASDSSKLLSDFGLRRRRSTGSRPSKTRSNSHPTPVKLQKSSSQTPSDTKLQSIRGAGLKSPPILSKSQPAAFSSSPGTASGSASTTGFLPQKKNKQDISKQQKQKPHFSTADRTILEELKRNISARAAQFVIKGVGNTQTDGTLHPGKRHHPYPRQDVPYPRSYEREVIDLDVWETAFCQDICESLTWHVFEEPPAKVLDLGCGTGTWILNCARTWRDTHFVGLDIVPLHPDLQQVGSIDYASRITWIQASFLEGLPFPNDEFDFVHIKRIALGVPEDKWDAFFDEVSRVMKPGAAFEMVEEDLFFPGKLADDDEEDENDPISPLSRSNSTSSNGKHSNHLANPDDTDDTSRSSEPGSPATPTTSTTAFPRTPSRSDFPIPSRQVSFVNEEDKADVKSDAGSTTPPGSPPGYITLIPPHSRSSARPLLYVRTTNSTPYTHFPFAATSPPRNHSQSFFGSSAVSLLNSLQHHPSDSDHHHHNLFRRRRSSSNLTPGIHPHAVPVATTSSENFHFSSHSADGHYDVPPPKHEKRPPPFLLRTPAKPPHNPRDHSILEHIYNEMLASRFINTSPLSLLTTYLEYHFKDARTHPPLLYMFPPVAVKPIQLENGSPDTDDDDDSDHQPAKQDVSPVRPTRKPSSPSMHNAFSKENGELLEEHRWLSMQGLLRHKSPYVSLDGAKGYAYSPSSTSFTIGRTKDGKPRRTSRLPNKTLNIDLRTLNLHLALRAKEILACSESMWEWVLEYQAAAQGQQAAKADPGGRVESSDVRQPHRSQSSLGAGSPTDLNKNAVLDLTRDDFDQILTNFELDMQDQASVNQALQERFQWNVIESPPQPSRKAFKTACRKYNKWLLKQQNRDPPNPYRDPLNRRSRNSLHSPSTTSITFPPSGPTIPQETSVRPTRGRSNSHTILMNRNGQDYQPNGHIAPSQLRPDAVVKFALPSSPTSSLPPTQRLSRSMSVFVAWKA